MAADGKNRILARSQEPPYSIQITPVEGCNLACDFCGIRGIQELPMHGNKYLSLEDAELIACQIQAAGWNSRIEFNFMGEPTLHPKLKEIFAIFRGHLRKNYFLMITNGAGILKGGRILENIVQFFNSGLDCIAVDCYKDEDIWQRIQTAHGEVAVGFLPYKIYNYPRQILGNPHKRVKSEKRLVYIADIRDNSNGNHSTICNQCGAADGIDMSNPKNGQRCPRPFREIALKYNGKIALCCNDWRGIYYIGDVHDMPIYELWQNDRFNAARQKLILGQRDFVPCFGCNAFTYRNGLLPDTQGKKAHEILAPDAVTEEILKEAVAQGNTVNTVVRPYDLAVDGMLLPVINPTPHWPPRDSNA